MRYMKKTPHASGGKAGTCSWWTTSAPRTGGRASGIARSARGDGRRGAPGRLLADDPGDRQLTTTAMSLTPSLPSSFQLASDEVHSWCASLDVPPETSARLCATLTPDERTRSARFQFERDQQRFIVARGVLRDLLGRY